MFKSPVFEWIKQEQNKHKLCLCGCGNEIIIKKHHHWYGIPKYLNGHGNQNKGKNHPLYGKKHSEKTRIKMSKSHSGKTLSEEHIKNISESQSGKNNHNYGKTFSEETRKKMSESKKIENNPMYGKTFSEEHKNKISGENHHNWQGGISFEPYCPKFNEKKKEEIREQYNRKCFNCGLDEKNNITKTNKIRKLSIHHIDYDKEQGCNGKTFELIPLCGSCHMKTNGNREYWRQLFINKLSDLNE